MALAATSGLLVQTAGFSFLVAVRVIVQAPPAKSICAATFPLAHVVLF